jgi:hypothetical protein
VLQSRSLGQVAIKVDRLLALVVHGQAGDATPEDFAVGDDGNGEALFMPAKHGFDTWRGAIERFTEGGVLFEWREGEPPREFGYDRLAAVALAGGIAPDRARPVRLLTRSGDRVAVDLIGASRGGAVFELEGERKVEVPWSEVAAITFMGPDRLFLSDLEPVQVRERAFIADADEPLYPYRRDRSCLGGPLVSQGVAYGKGLGVHSRSLLTYRVPESAARFFTLVGLDDSVLELDFGGAVDVRVLLDGEVLGTVSGLRRGQPAHNFGALEVAPGRLLTLEVDFGAGIDIGDRVDWLSPVFLLDSR